MGGDGLTVGAKRNIMAEIVLGIGMSHSPMLSTPVEMWPLHVERDRKNTELHFRGRVYDFAELRQLRAAEQLERHLSEKIWRAKQVACQQAIAALAKRLDAITPDVVVIIGDDQQELFHDDNMPSLAIFWGHQIECIPPVGKAVHPSIEVARRDQYGDERVWYAVESGLGRHLVEQMMAKGFDVAQFTRQPEGRTIGHAFTFVWRRIIKGKTTPIVPVMVNSFYPPNQPRAGRCYAFGRALRRAIESWDSRKRVAVVGSGGLTHFVIDEEVDRIVLEAMMERDERRLCGVGEELLQSGSSEIKNWIVAAGALESLRMKLIDYVPAYRSESGTGCAMAFAEWL
jgi:hypothetical protein